MQNNKASVNGEEVPKEAEAKCRTASDECPAGAITIEA
ncbi:ferredoxin [Candidatus Omnitrophota bacterium]